MFTYRSFLTKSASTMSLWRKYNRLHTLCYRSLCTASGVETITEEQKLAAMDDEERLVYNAQKFGADLAFNTSKHGYILSFPWNYDEIIKDFEEDFTPLKATASGTHGSKTES